MTKEETENVKQVMAYAESLEPQLEDAKATIRQLECSLGYLRDKERKQVFIREFNPKKFTSNYDSRDKAETLDA